jgi:CubicO group peptidase (beta-lactamase class C family)
MTGSVFTDSGLTRLGEIAAERVLDGTVPGLVVLVSRGDQVQVEAHGALGTDDDPPVRRDSLFRITSNTKPITAAVTLALVDEGLFELDEPVDRLVPELASRRVLRRPDGPLDDTVPADRAVTVRDLLTFTFGFGMAVEMFFAPSPWPVMTAEADLRLNTFGPPDPEVPPDPDTWIANLGTLPLLAQPGERWLYNTGAQVLGVLCERAAGRPFPDVLKTRIFEPLGMRDTAFWANDTSRLATAYRPTPEGLVLVDEPAGKWSKPPSFCDGAAGLVSTADDLLAFARTLLRRGEPVLQPDLVRSMTTDQLTARQKARGGLGPDFFADKSWGFCQAVQANGAYGWAGGFGTTWLVDPAEDLVVIVLTQRMFEDPGTPGLHTEIQEAAYAALAGRHVVT